MTSAVISIMLCYIMAMGMALPSKVAVSEDLKAESQWHLQAPSHGCVEISHSVGGTVFRSYACDGANGEFCDYKFFRFKLLKSYIFKRIAINWLLFYDHTYYNNNNYYYYYT